MLLAQASTHLWHGKCEDVTVLLEGALTEAQRDGLPGLELEALGMVAFVDSVQSRTNHADEADQRAYALRRGANLGIPPVLDLAAALRSLIAGDLDGRARALRRILLPDVVGADPGLEVALKLGYASMLLAEGQAYRGLAGAAETLAAIFRLCWRFSETPCLRILTHRWDGRGRRCGCCGPISGG